MKQEIRVKRRSRRLKMHSYRFVFLSFLVAGCASTPEEVIQARTPWTLTGARPDRAVILSLEGLPSSLPQSDILSRFAGRGLVPTSSLGHLPNTPKTNFEVLTSGKTPRRLSRTADYPLLDTPQDRLKIVPLSELVSQLKGSLPGDVFVSRASLANSTLLASASRELEDLEKTLEQNGWNRTLLVVALTPQASKEKPPRSPVVDPAISRYEAQGALASYWLKKGTERENAKLAMRLKFQAGVREVYTRAMTAGGTHYVRTYRNKELASTLSYAELVETLPPDKGPDVMAILDSQSANPLGQNASLVLWSPNLTKSSANFPDVRWMDILPGVYSALGRTTPDGGFDGDAARFTFHLQSPTP